MAGGIHRNVRGPRSREERQWLMVVGLGATVVILLLGVFLLTQLVAGRV